MAFALIALGGELARRSLVQDAIPDVSDPQIVLVAEWPGHLAPEVASSVTTALTFALEGVAGAAAVRGSSMTGLAYVDVVFPSARDLPRGRAEIIRRIAAVRTRLPANVRVSVGPEASSTGWVLEYALVAPTAREAMHGDGSGGPSLFSLRRFQDDVLRPALAPLAGVAEIASVGGETEEMLVAVRPDELRQGGLALSDVVTTLRREIAASPSASVEQIGSIAIAGPREANDRHPPRRLAELATVRLTREMTGGMADVDGLFPAVGGIVIAKRDADVVSLAGQVRKVLDRQRSLLPAGVELVIVYDRSDLARRVGGTLLRALGEEIAVVVLVVLAFLLHGRSAVVPLATLPLVLGLTFIAMWIAGVPATVMSLGGIGIALGMAVDADLVALEACHRRLESAGPICSEEDRRARILAAAGSLVPAILTSLVIAALTFAPAFAFTGETARLLRPLVLTKTLVIGAATLVALTAAPALRDRLLRGRMVPEFANPLTRGLVNVYRPFVHFVLARPLLTLVTAGLLAISCVPLLGRLGGEFLPRLDEGDLLFMPTTSPDVPAELAASELERQDRALYRTPEVSIVFGKIGRADTATDPAPCSMAETTVHLKPRPSWPTQPRARWYSTWAPPALARVLRLAWPDETVITTAELIEKLDREVRMPGWTNAWTAPVRARMDMMSTGVRTPVGIRIVASDPARLDVLAGAVRAIVEHVPGTRSAVYEPRRGETHLRFVIDPIALARHQVEEEAVRGTADLMLGGGVLGQIEQGGRQVPLRLAADLAPRPLEELIREATVRAAETALGQPVPLGLLGHPAFVRGPAMLRTERGRDVAYVYVDLAGETELLRYVERARRAVDDVIARGDLWLGPDERIEWAGQYDLIASGQRRLMIIAPIVALSMLALLFLQFRSWTEALLVLVSVPLALVGSVWTIFLLGYRLSPPVWVGLLSVLGLAMQTGVVMVIYIDEAFYRRVREGRLTSRDDIVAAHAEGTVRRLRPKIMTVATMAAALLPLLWAEGAGADIMKRVAAPMVGGLASSAFLTLEVIPVLYTIWRHRQLRRAQRTGQPIEKVVGSVPGWAR